MSDAPIAIAPIHGFDDFCRAVGAAGFTPGGANPEGVFSLSAHFAPGIRWHTEDPDTDPWEWRMRVLTEREDIAYAKLFFGKSGYVGREWYPCFLAARRGGKKAGLGLASFTQAYNDGLMTATSKRMMALFEKHGTLATHQLRALGEFRDKSKFDRALIELQMRMFITMCGHKRKRSTEGVEYGWNSAVFVPADGFFGPAALAEAEALDRDEAAEAIARQALRLNPQADPKKLERFIYGGRKPF